MRIAEYFNKRNVLFCIFCAISLIIAYLSLKGLYYSSSNREYYSHIILIPPISLYLIYQTRKEIFSKIEYSYNLGIPLLLAGGLIYFMGKSTEAYLNQNDFSSIIAFSTFIFINGAFILCYGIHAFKVAIFPLVFLLFIIPIPSLIMDGIIHFLQIGSAEFTNWLLMLSGIPYLRDGFVFHLPGQSVEVAKECSGIRSSLALFITALLAGHLFLRTWWKKIILVICVFPIAMFKNGIRITTLTLLGTYVDPRILQSSLHREGGIPFFIVALVLMAPILFFLRKSEGRDSKYKDKEKLLDSGSRPK
jgi:exosortase